MEQGNIMQQMASYDLNSQLTVQTIIEDSDDDTLSTFEMSSKITSIANSDSLNGAKITAQKVNINSTQTIVNNISNKIQPIQTSEVEIQSHNNGSYSNENFNNTERNHKRMNSRKRTPSMKKDNLQSKKKRVNKANTKRKIKDCGTINKNENKNNDPLQILFKINETQKVSAYVSGLFTAISQQLIAVINAHNLYIKAKENDNSNQKYESLNAYLHVKDQSFMLAYITVINLLLPEEHNRIFVNSFIKRTVIIADADYSMKLSYDEVRICYNEMLEWSKRKRIDHYPPEFNKRHNRKSVRDERYSALREQLMQPAKPLSNHINNLDNFQERNPGINNLSSKTFSAAPARRDDSVNTLPFIRNQRTQTSLSNLSCNRSSINNNHNNYVSEEVLTPNKSQEFDQFTKKSQISATRSFQDVHLTPLSRQTSQIHNENHTTKDTYLFSSHSNFSLLETTNRDVTASINENSPKNCIQETLSLPALNIINSRSRISLYSDHGIYTSHHQNNEPESQNTLEILRSVSTDSGCVSPLNFSDPNEHEHEHQTDTSLQEVSTPQITYITSLNPNVSYHKEDSCKVCGKPTKRKCLGCLKNYYCDDYCQHADWSDHMYACGKTNNK